MTYPKVVREGKSRGVALMMTLAVAFFLVTLLGAFIIVHRSSNSLTISGQKRQRAYNACLSGLHVLWGELELNPLLGGAGLPDGRVDLFPPTDPVLKLTFHGDSAEPGEIPDIDTNYIEGELLDTGDTFVIRFINNFANRSPTDVTQLGIVPARCAKVEVTGTSSGVNLKLESVLRKKPYVDYSMLASEEIQVAIDPDGEDEDDRWTIGSEDPYINQIRSNTEIIGPSALDGDLKFVGPPRGGVAKAVEEVTLGGIPIQSDSDFWAQSEKQADGTFQPGAGVVDVPDLKREDLNLPANSTSLDGGTLSMRVVEKHEWVPQQFPIDLEAPFGVPEGWTTRYRVRKSLHQAVQYNEEIWIGHSGWTPSGGDQPLTHPSQGQTSPGTNGFFAPDGASPLPSSVYEPSDENDNYPVMREGDGYKVQADLTTGEVAFSPGTRFSVEGGFKTSRESGAHKPKLLMGYEIQPGMPPKLLADSVDPDTAAKDPDKYGTALVASGAIDLEGPVSGYGTIFSEGAVSLEAKPTIAADPALAVALHGESIRFKVEGPYAEEKRNQIALETDWNVFQKAIDTDPGNDERGFSLYEDWHKNNTPPMVEGKDRTIGDDPDDAGNAAKLRYRKTGLTGNEAWNDLKIDLGLSDDEAPVFTDPPFDTSWGSGDAELTLEQYIGLREYLRKPELASRNKWILLNGGATGHEGFEQITSQIRRQIDFYSNWSDYMNKDIDEFMMAEKLRIADVFFVGLVHAGLGGFTAESNDYSLYFEGALVSRKAINIENTPWANFIYNREYLDDVIKHNFEDPVPLDQVYFKVN